MKVFNNLLKVIIFIMAVGGILCFIGYGGMMLFCALVMGDDLDDILVSGAFIIGGGVFGWFFIKGTWKNVFIEKKQRVNYGGVISKNDVDKNDKILSNKELLNYTNEELVAMRTYIQQAQARGLSKTEVIKNLKNAGWADGIVKNILKSVYGNIEQYDQKVTK